jgi:phage repressor protein C with HTH and peptisase S24 domain
MLFSIVTKDTKYSTYGVCEHIVIPYMEYCQLEYKDKIKILRESLSYTQKQFAELTSIPLSTLNKIEGGFSNVGISVIDKIIQTPSLKEHILWLMTGDSPLNQIENSTSGDHIQLPFYEVAASAGNGTLVENEELAHNISFRAEWLRKDLGVNPNDIFVMLTKGDSMDPTIKEDALIMVDKNTQKHINGIYVLRFNGELLVKRLQFTMSNTIKVISDNKAYDTEEINPEQLTGTDLEIIGRVVWSGQRM